MNLLGKKRRTAPPVSRYLDLIGEENGILYGSRGRYARIFSLSGVDLFGKSETDLTWIHRGIQALLSHLPEGMSLQFRVNTQVGIPKEGDLHMPDWFQKESSGGGREHDRVGKYRNDRWTDMERRLFRNRELFLTVVSHAEPPKQGVHPSLFPLRAPGASSSKFSMEKHQKRINQLMEIANLIETLLPGCGILGTPLDRPRIHQYLYRILNPGTPTDPILFPNGEIRSGDSLGERLSQTAFHESPSELKAFNPDGTTRYGRFHALRLLPALVDRETLAPVLQGIDFSHDLVMNLWKPEREQTLKAVQSQMTVNRFLSLLLPGKSYRLAAETRQQEQFLDQAHESLEEESIPFLMNLSVAYWSLDPDDLPNMGKEILKGFSEAMGAVMAHEPYRQWPLFLAGLPLQGDSNDRWEILLSGALTHLLPVWDKPPDHETPWFWTKNHLDEPVGLDFWHNSHSNHNGLILGQSGSGKSFGTKLLLGQFLSDSPSNHAIIVENGGDFERFSLFFEGEYLKIDLSGRFSLNPFPSRRELEISEGPPRIYDPDLMGVLEGVLETFLVPGMTVGALHRKILSSCIETVYDQLTGPDKRPVLSVLAQSLLQYRGRDREDETLSYSMGKILESWASGIYGSLLNNPAGLERGGRLIAFDLSALDSHAALKGIVFSFIASLALYRLKEEGSQRRLYLVFDEAHRILHDLRGTEFLTHLYRTVRKFGGGVIAISQSPGDFLEEELAEGVVNNTFWKWIFPLQNGHGSLGELGFHQREQELSRTLVSEKGTYSECLLKMGTESRLLRLEPSPLAFWISARSPEEDARFQQALQTTGSIDQALDFLVRERILE
ncbi:MAG: VirB4 family type IV secretion system protein [Leptospirales bacterium]